MGNRCVCGGEHFNPLMAVAIYGWLYPAVVCVTYDSQGFFLGVLLYVGVSSLY